MDCSTACSVLVEPRKHFEDNFKQYRKFDDSHGQNCRLSLDTLLQGQKLGLALYQGVNHGVPAILTLPEVGVAQLMERA